MIPSALFEDMRARRLAVLEAKGQPLPAEADEDMVGVVESKETQGMSLASSDLYAEVRCLRFSWARVPCYI
jgi:hypothetical protein